MERHKTRALEVLGKEWNEIKDSRKEGPHGNVRFFLCLCHFGSRIVIPDLIGNPCLRFFNMYFVILVKSGWDPTARPEADEPRCDQKIFHQKNTCGVVSGDPSLRS